MVHVDKTHFCQLIQMSQNLLMSPQRTVKQSRKSKLLEIPFWFHTLHYSMKREVWSLVLCLHCFWYCDCMVCKRTRHQAGKSKGIVKLCVHFVSVCLKDKKMTQTDSMIYVLFFFLSISLGKESKNSNSKNHF